MHKLKMKNTLDLPMHVHCNTIELPVAPAKGKTSAKLNTLQVHNPLPEFFQETLRELKLKTRTDENDKREGEKTVEKL